MLTTQLDSQRYYFEQNMESQAKEFHRELEKLQLKLAENSDKKQALEYNLAETTKSRNALDKKVWIV